MSSASTAERTSSGECVNEYLLAVLLGVIEGLTEFLPVSSTAHLRIAEAMLGVDLGNAYWKTFTIVIQLGAILCLPFYFRRRLVEFALSFPRGTRGDRTAVNHPFTLTLIAFVTTAIPAFLLTKIIGKHLESLYVMALSLILGGIVMWVVDAIYERSQGQAFARGWITETMEEMSVGQAVWIGACQILSALFPGTSRSMATITAGELAGMTRSVALEFSFFLSIPTMAAATLYDLLKSLRPRGGEPSAIGAMPHDAHAWVVLAIGFVVSFVVAYGVVGWFLGWVRRRGLTPFAIYRIVVGAAVLVWAIRLG
jgi:undecaprenyl-diphosphatase